MAYGFTPVSGASSNSSSTATEATGSHVASSSRFNSRTVSETAGNELYIVDREGHQSFTTFRELLSDRHLWRNFKDQFSLYQPDVTFEFESPEARHDVLQSEQLSQLFLLINDVQVIPGITREIELEAERPQDAPPQVQAVSDQRSDSSQILCNPDMEEPGERIYSLTSQTAREVSRTFPRGFRNVNTLSSSGFYFSYDLGKVQCFCCGGTVEQELIQNSTDLDQLHGKFYPDCNFLRQKKGEPFIRNLQNNLTEAERTLVANSRPDIPYLYSRPVSDAARRRNRMLRQRDFDRLSLLEGRFESLTLQDTMQYHRTSDPTRVRQRFQQLQLPQPPALNSGIGDSCNASLEHLRSKLSPEQFLALDRLRNKVTAAFYQREILEQSLLEILHQLDACPEPEVREVAGEITEIINAAQDQDCQDHTSEVIDQIKTRLLFMALKQELASETTPTSALRFFCKLKLFFNESVLYKVLATTNDSRGLPLIASRESTEIRGYVKNHLARAVCQFPATHILQRYSSLGRPAAEVMENIENVFRHGINNQADFAQYLTDLFLADRQFMELLQQLDGDLSIRCAKSQSNAELLMEVYDPLTATSGVSEQELLEGAGNVAQTREQWIREDLQQFIDEQIREHWAVITIETSL